MLEKIAGYMMLGGVIATIVVGLVCIGLVAWREMRDLEDPVGGIGEESESNPCKGCLEQCECNDAKCGKEG